MLIGYDIDGVLNKVKPQGNQVVIISGRTFSEYDHFCKSLSESYPVYIRGAGTVGDREAAGKFKAAIINLLGVTEFYEDDPLQASIIKKETGIKIKMV